MTIQRGLACVRGMSPVVVSTIGVLAVILASAVTVGADTMWLVALGRHVVSAGAVPAGVPFATADSTGWVNVPILGELVFAGISSLGPSALPLAQILVDVCLLVLLTLSARKLGARGGAISFVLIVVAVGSLPALGVVRSQTMSLLPFAALLLLLRAEHREPSPRIWLVVPLFVLWGNLHGAVLVGVGLVLCHLALSRFRKQPGLALGVGLASVTAVWVTPGGMHTGEYYLGVLTNEAARRGTQLWAPLSLGNGIDLLLLAASIILIGFFLVARPPLWELVAGTALLLGTASASRHGVWLLLFLAAPAAAGLTATASRVRVAPHEGALPAPLTAGIGIALAALATALVLGRADGSSTTRIVSAVRHDAGAGPVLATEPVVESLASAGVKVWMSNPIDAFSRDEQGAYLDFLEGRGGPDAVPASVRVAVVPVGSASSEWAISAGFTPSQVVEGYQILIR